MTVPLSAETKNSIDSPVLYVVVNAPVETQIRSLVVSAGSAPEMIDPFTLTPPVKEIDPEPWHIASIETIVALNGILVKADMPT